MMWKKKIFLWPGLASKGQHSIDSVENRRNRKICCRLTLSLFTWPRLLIFYVLFTLPVTNRLGVPGVLWQPQIFADQLTLSTPARPHFISGLKAQVLKLTFWDKNDSEKWSRFFFILKFTEPLMSCCRPVQKNLPERLVWQGQLKGACWISKKKF